MRWRIQWLTFSATQNEVSFCRMNYDFYFLPNFCQKHPRLRESWGEWFIDGKWINSELSSGKNSLCLSSTIYGKSGSWMCDRKHELSLKQSENTTRPLSSESLNQMFSLIEMWNSGRKISSWSFLIVSSRFEVLILLKPSSVNVCDHKNTLKSRYRVRKSLYGAHKLQSLIERSITVNAAIDIEWSQINRQRRCLSNEHNFDTILEWSGLIYAKIFCWRHSTNILGTAVTLK